MKKPLDLTIADQLEALAIAIAMALVLKFFLVEAYEIPSGSMQPTILGDPGTGIFDRVLADKLTTMLRAPRRWEVMIFRFPNDERALYVKRIVGLPGEKLAIRGGDVWVDDKIARKPDPVVDSVLKDVFRADDGGIDLNVFSAGPGVRISGTRAEFAADATGELTLRASVRDDFLHGYDPSWGIQANDPGMRYAVADLEVSADVLFGKLGETNTPESRSPRTVKVGIESDEGMAEFEVAWGDSGGHASVAFRASNGEAPIVSQSRSNDEILSYFGNFVGPGTPFRLLARSVDHELVLCIDGKEILRVPDDISGARPAHPKKALVHIGLTGGGTVSDVRLRRDIFYTPATQGDSTWDIPEGHYLALGDNTQGSLDSRGWKQRTLLLRPGSTHTADGTEVESWTGFDFDNPRAPDANPHRLGGGQLAFANLHGDVIHVREADVVSQSLEPAPLIDQRYLLGKAVAVFWPVFHPFRWKLIR
ncbi:MAG TPA: signal peptidase I [Planctomycetota bacterium]|nr:signal peptidase I [Planctomycetota bacterium]